MSIAELRLIYRCAEYKERNQIKEVPRCTRGIYALYKYRRKINRYDVVYVGMAQGKAGILGRLRAHNRWKNQWTHFSIFEVWANITQQEVEELEGLFRHIYRSDTHTNALNVQRKYKKLIKVRNNDTTTWKRQE
ncbi:MAG: GIY-YIG nuclease family protein [Candidatus Dadabacteria bacterium]|nr:GIY-YIG nuclease family protein [Candidatus Dadabacteria bacterium]